jgi:hypothetical protein
MTRLLVPQRVVRGYRDGSIRQLRLLVVLPKWMRFQKDGAIEMHCEGSIYIDQDPHSLIDDGYLKPPVLPGQEFWMAETWAYENYVYWYRADMDTDGRIPHLMGGEGGWGGGVGSHKVYRWRSSVTMPFSAARTFGAARTVRVQRLWDITTDEAFDEGITWGMRLGQTVDNNIRDKYPFLNQATDTYRIQWDAEHPRDPWASNCWTWIIEPERSKA